MKIKKFFENLNGDRLDIIKECFFNITDEYDVNLVFNKIGESYYRINISVGKSISIPFGTDGINELNKLSDRYSLLSKLYREIYVSLKRLEDHDLIDFELSCKSEHLIILDCYFKSEDINTFISVEDYIISQDKSKLKEFFKRNFNTIVKNSYFDEDSDRDDQYYIKFIIECVSIENSDKIKEYMMSLKSDNDINIFRYYWTNNVTFIELEINGIVNYEN